MATTRELELLRLLRESMQRETRLERKLLNRGNEAVKNTAANSVSTQAVIREGVNGWRESSNENYRRALEAEAVIDRITEALGYGKFRTGEYEIPAREVEVETKKVPNFHLHRFITAALGQVELIKSMQEAITAEREALIETRSKCDELQRLLEAEKEISAQWFKKYDALDDKLREKETPLVSFPKTRAALKEWDTSLGEKSVEPIRARAWKNIMDACFVENVPVPSLGLSSEQSPIEAIRKFIGEEEGKAGSNG